VAKGNRIVLDGDGSYIINKATGKKTALKVSNGVYTFDLWVERAAGQQEAMELSAGPKSSEAPEVEAKVVDSLARSGFPWRVSFRPYVRRASWLR